MYFDWFVLFLANAAFWKFVFFLNLFNAEVWLWFYFGWVEFGECGGVGDCVKFTMCVWCFRCIGSVWGLNELLLRMDDVAGLAEAAGSRFTSLELIGQGSFGDVYKG